MDENKIKEELVMHLAKSILAQTVDGKRRILELVIAMCTFLVPAYVALLKVFQEELQCVLLFVKILPILVWVSVLLFSIYKAIPEARTFDFKNPDSIIDSHLSGSKSSRKMGVFLVGTTVITLVGAIVLILNYTMA